MTKRRVEEQCVDCGYKTEIKGKEVCAQGEDLYRYDECKYKKAIDSQTHYFADTSDQIDPSHYTDLSPQPYEVINAWKLPGMLAFALKYIARAGKKEGVPEEVDLSKAIRCIELYLKN